VITEPEDLRHRENMQFPEIGRSRSRSISQPYCRRTCQTELMGRTAAPHPVPNDVRLLNTGHPDPQTKELNVEIIRGRVAGQATQERTGPFTGTAWGDHLLDADGVAMSTVYFAPGARTFWHHHERGQLLTITSGEGLVVSRDGTVGRVRAGDMIWTRPGEEHWHGACQGSFLAHTSTTIGSTTWLEEVSPPEYTQANDGNITEAGERA
jgi:quercetin dioxygenase-like cupin family protein